MEHLLEIVSVRARTSADRNLHIDQAVAACSFFAAEKNCVGISDHRDMLERWIVGVHKRQTTSWIISRDTWHGAITHDVSPLQSKSSIEFSNGYSCSCQC